MPLTESRSDIFSGHSLRVALIADDITRHCLLHECRIRDVTPLNYLWILSAWKPDLLFVESAWQGRRGAWKYGIAAYPNHPTRNNHSLQKVVTAARERGIPCVFWNREDGVHFHRFIDSARLFDHIFTVDENCIPWYRSVVDSGVSVEPLPFAVQPALHYFSGFHFRRNRALFVGSYNRQIHDARRRWQHLFFRAAEVTGLGLTVVDRNSSRKSSVYRYPDYFRLELRPAVPHADTERLYKEYLVSVNVNTVEDSPTMYSRRLVEILACGGIAVTNPSPAVDLYFRDFCHVVRNVDEAESLFSRLRQGPSPDDLARAEAGAAHVLQHHTWTHRLERLCQVVGIEPRSRSERVSWLFGLSDRHSG